MAASLAWRRHASKGGASRADANSMRACSDSVTASVACAINSLRRAGAMSQVGRSTSPPRPARWGTPGKSGCGALVNVRLTAAGEPVASARLADWSDMLVTSNHHATWPTRPHGYPITKDRLEIKTQHPSRQAKIHEWRCSCSHCPRPGTRLKPIQGLTRQPHHIVSGQQPQACEARPVGCRALRHILVDKGEQPDQADHRPVGARLAHGTDRRACPGHPEHSTPPPTSGCAAPARARKSGPSGRSHRQACSTPPATGITQSHHIFYSIDAEIAEFYS